MTGTLSFFNIYKRCSHLMFCNHFHLLLRSGAISISPLMSMTGLSAQL